MFCKGYRQLAKDTFIQFENFSIQVFWEFMKLKKNNTKNKYIVKKAFFHKMLFENPVPFTMCSQITIQPNVK